MALAFDGTHKGDLSFSSSPTGFGNSDTTGMDWVVLVINNFNATLANITSILYNGVEHVSALRINATTAHFANNFHAVCAFALGADAGNHAFQITWTGGGLIDFQWAAGTGSLHASVYDGAATSTEDTASANVSTPTPYTGTTAGALPFFLFDPSASGANSALANCTKIQASGLVSQMALYSCPTLSAGGSTSATLNNTGVGFNLTFAMALKPAGGGTTTGTGSSSGAGTALAAGAAFASAVGVSAGVGTATGISTASATIALNGIKPYFSGVGQMFPYAAALSGLTNVTVTGTYTGAAPTHVNYRLGGTGSFVGISTEVIGGGNWSGVIPNVAIGDVQLEIQESNNTNVNIDVANVKTTLGLGDIFGIIGDSEGLMPNAGTVTASGVNGHTRWLHPTNGWVDWDITPQFEQAAWAYFGNEVTAKRLAPCFILNGASAGTALANWRHGVSQFDAAVVLFSAANGGLTAIMVPNLGTNDARQGNGLVTATVAAAMAATAADAATYMSATAPLFWPGVAELDTNTGSGNLRAELDTVRKALTATISGSVHWAAFLQDQVYATDGLHPDANDVADIGRRHFLAVTDTLYGTSVGSGPRFVAATIDGTNKIIVVTVDRDLANSISSAVTAFRVYDNGVSVTITSQVVTSLRVITITLPSAIVGTPTLDFASGNDAKGATVPVRAVETLPSGATTQRILQYFSNQTVTPAGTGIGAAAGTGTAFGIGRSTAVAVGSAGGAAIVLGHPPIPFRPLAALTSNRLVGLPESNA